MPRILVVGAGLAGLASALAFRRSGHHVQIIEASELPFEDIEGPVVQIGPKVNDILKNWKCDTAVSRGVLIKEVAEYDQDGLLRRSEESQPPGWVYYQRSRLHKALMDAAKASSGTGQPVEIFLNTKVTSANRDTGVVTVQDGRSFTGDLVIGADGLHSTTRKAFPYETVSAGSRTVTVHFRVATAKLLDNAAIRRFHCQPERYEKWFGDDVELKVFSIDPEHLIFDTTLPILNGFDLSPALLKRQISDAFTTADAQFRDLLGVVNPEDIQFWSYNSMPHVGMWTSKRLVLIGDAAHPFLPYEPPGTSQSITGAAALDNILTPSFDVDEIQARLEAWEIPRKERVKFIQGVERKAWPSN